MERDITNKNYQEGYEDGVYDAEKELYEDFLSKLTDLKQGNHDIDALIQETSNELTRRMR